MQITGRLTLPYVMLVWNAKCGMMRKLGSEQVHNDRVDVIGAGVYNAARGILSFHLFLARKQEGGGDCGKLSVL